jgi:hypothetical protein
VAELGTSGPPNYCRFIPGYSAAPCIEAVLQYGDNGPGAIPELVVNSVHEGNFPWQLTNQVLFNSELVSVELRVAVGGVSTLTAAGGPRVGSATESTIATEFITGVEIGAHVVTIPKRRLRWSNLVAKYYKNGVLREAVMMPAECEPKATTYPPAGPAAQIASYPPTTSDNDAVTVTGIIQLEGDRGVPNFEFDPSDFYGKILVFATNCHPR